MMIERVLNVVVDAGKKKSAVQQNWPSKLANISSDPAKVDLDTFSLALQVIVVAIRLLCSQRLVFSTHARKVAAPYIRLINEDDFMPIDLSRSEHSQHVLPAIPMPKRVALHNTKWPPFFNIGRILHKLIIQQINQTITSPPMPIEHPRVHAPSKPSLIEDREEVQIPLLNIVGATL
jgi:hypothetical protein